MEYAERNHQRRHKQDVEYLERKTQTIDVGRELFADVFHDSVIADFGKAIESAANIFSKLVIA